MNNKQVGRAKYNSISKKRFDDLYDFGWRFYKQNEGTRNSANKTFMLSKMIYGNRSTMRCQSIGSTLNYIINKSQGKIDMKQIVDMRRIKHFSAAEDAIIVKFCILNTNGTLRSRLQKAQKELEHSLGVVRNLNSVIGRHRALRDQIEKEHKVKVKTEATYKHKKPSIAKEVVEKTPRVLSEIELLDLIGKQDKKTLELLKTYIEFKLS